MEFIIKLKNKLFEREVIMYIIFGVLTTLVNWITFFSLVYVFQFEENLANIIAITFSILFAYITNSLIVFKSKVNNLKDRFIEFIRFILGRAFTMVVELVGFYFMFNILNISDWISKPLITFIVIVLNYFISKYFSFK